MENEKKITQRIILYLVLTFVFTYLIEFGVIHPMAQSQDPGQAAISQYMAAFVMMVPAICVLLTRLITREGFKGCWIKPVKMKKTFKYYLIGWFGPAVLTLGGAALYFIIYPASFDPDAGALIALVEAQGGVISAEAARITLIVQLAVAVIIGPALNAINCFGEEWGWRGYLVPKMSQKTGMVPMLLITGVIWGLWHAPLTMIGHNYGVGYPGFPFTGILAMCIFCIAFGIFFSYLALKSRSCLPAVFAHGGLNAVAGIGIYFTKDGGNPFIGPAPTGIIGGAAVIILAVFLTVKMLKLSFDPDPKDPAEVIEEQSGL